MELTNSGKTELRAACKANGISYGKLTVAGMRAALAELTTTKTDTAASPDTVQLPEAKPEPMVTKERVHRREVRNNVARPMRGVCADLWSTLDELRTKGEHDLTTAIHTIGQKRGWNKNNISCELSAYRRFHGISARKGKDAEAV